MCGVGAATRFLALVGYPNAASLLADIPDPELLWKFFFLNCTSLYVCPVAERETYLQLLAEDFKALQAIDGFRYTSPRSFSQLAGLVWQG